MRLCGYKDQWALVLADLVDRPSLSHLSLARPASLRRLERARSPLSDAQREREWQ